MKTKNKRIKIKKTLKKRGGGAKFSTVQPPKKISPSPSPSSSPIKIKKTRFHENPISDEWDQSPRSSNEFYFPLEKPKTNLEIDTEDIKLINEKRKKKNKPEIAINKYINKKSEERIEKQKQKKIHVKNQMKSKNPLFRALADKRNKELQLAKDIKDLKITKAKMQMQMKL